MAEAAAAKTAPAMSKVLVPLALAQFICSFAGSNMSVMIKDISGSLNTTVHGVQIAITAFLLVMAALMIPGGKLADRYGRVRMLRWGLIVYGLGAVVAAVAPGIGVLMVGYSFGQGVGTAMLIPPVYILTTLLFTEVTSRAKAFGMVMAAAGIGSAAGPLIGGLITTAISWRAAFVFQALIVAVIVWLCRRLVDPLPPDATSRFDLRGAILSALGLILVVTGIQAASTNGWLTAGLVAAGALVLVWFFFTIRAEERAGKTPLLSTALFRNRTSNLGLTTQIIQWLMLLGSQFTIATYLQVVRGFSAIQTGAIFTSATVGLLLSSLNAERFARRHSQRALITTGFAVAIAGSLLLLIMASGSPSVWAATPGLFVFGVGIGFMLTPSVNVVQSSFTEDQQGEISGLSRSISNLGSSLGTALAGTILISTLTQHAYAASIIVLSALGLIGLGAALLLPGHLAPANVPPARQSTDEVASHPAAQRRRST